MHSEGTVKSVVAKNLKDFLTSVHLGNYLTSKIAEYFNHVELVQLFGEDDVDAVEEFSDVEIKAIESELKNEFNNYSLLLDFLKEKGVETSTKVISPLVDVLNMYPNLNFDLIDQIDAGTDDDATKTIKKNIVKAEAHVHTALICTIKEIDPADRTKEIGGPLDGTFNVPNQVDQSGPTAYQVSDSDSVDPSKINLEDEDQISNKLGIDIDQAERILDERIANGNYNNRANLLSRVTELSQNQVDSWYESGLLSFGT